MRSAWLCASMLAVAVWSELALSAPPLDTLLPATTKGALFSPDIPLFQEKWDQTQFGRWLDDPLMQPFVDDVRAQVRDEQNPDRIDYGLSWEDVERLGRGPAAIALVHTPSQRPVRVILVDVTGNQQAAAAVLTKIYASLNNRYRAPWRQPVVEGTKLTVFNLPRNPRDPHRPAQAAYFIKDNILAAVEDEGVATFIISRLAGKGDARQSLADAPAYQQVLNRCQADALQQGEPHAHLYLEPVAYARARRQLDPEFLMSGRLDMLRAMERAGFTGVQGIGASLHLTAGPYDALVRLAVYAPPPLEKSLKMFETPNIDMPAPYDWLPATLATHTDMSWNLKTAIDNFGPLYDQTVGNGDEGTWQDSLKSIRDDPQGPQLDMEKRLFAYLGERLTQVSDVVTPTTINSERRLLIAALTDAAAVQKALEEYYANDVTAKQKQAGAQKYWEIYPEEEAEEPAIPSGVAVAHDCLLMASHADMLTRFFGAVPGGKQLGDDPEFQLVMRHIEQEAQRRSWSKLGMQRFVRSQQALEPTYELTRSNELPQSNTLLANLLNIALGQGGDGQPRQQEADGRKLPPYDQVKHYLMPAGSLGVREQGDFEGWFAVGFVLANKNGDVARE